MALVFLAVGSIIVSFLLAIPATLLALPPGTIVANVLVAAGGMWFSRAATDWALKRYSGRAVFIVVLSISLVASTVIAMAAHHGANKLLAYAQFATLVGAAYFWFWRRESESLLARASRIENGKAVAGVMLGCLPMVLFIVFGLVQYTAITAQLESFAHIGGFWGGALSWALTYFPIVGSIVGFFGARDVWGWPWWQAALLYFGIPTGFLLISMVVSAAGTTLEMTRRADSGERPIN